jgi:hypothetical protein
VAAPEGLDYKRPAISVIDAPARSQSAVAATAPAAPGPCSTGRAMNAVARPTARAAARSDSCAAAAAGDPEAVHLWAGTGYQQAVAGPAADVLRALASAS